MNDIVNAQIAELRVAFIKSAENVRMREAGGALRVIAASFANGSNCADDKARAEMEWDTAAHEWNVAYRAYLDAVDTLRATMQ
jgi:hypothetical protein